MSVLISLSHVDFGYENTDAVKDLTMDVEEGDYLCVVGSNGSGKSTLMKGLLGLLHPTAGTLTMADSLKKTGVGYLPQQTASQKNFPATVFEVVLSGTLGHRGNRPFYSAVEKKIARDAMEKLGISNLSDYCYRELSGGQQQRVRIARALCATRQMLILDEPITGLDPSAIQEFYQLIRKLNREEKVTIIMVSHDITNVISQANKVLHLQQKVVFCGTAEDYRKTEAGRQYLGGESV